MRAKLVLALALLIGCRPHEVARTVHEDASGSARKQDGMTHATIDATTEPRYLVVWLKRSFRAIWPDVPPLAPAHEMLIALPERDVVTFEIELDQPIHHRMMIFSRGWTVGDDGVAHAAVDMSWRWRAPPSIEKRAGRTVEDNSGLKELNARPDDARPGVAVGGSFYDTTDWHFQGITTSPPAGAILGVPDTVDGQHAKEQLWIKTKTPVGQEK